jgi:hypothetical protein
MRPVRRPRPGTHRWHRGHGSLERFPTHFAVAAERFGRKRDGGGFTAEHGLDVLKILLGIQFQIPQVLGALVVIGVFVFWCDVTDSWNDVFLWNKTGKH